MKIYTLLAITYYQTLSININAKNLKFKIPSYSHNGRFLFFKSPFKTSIKFIRCLPLRPGRIFNWLITKHKALWFVDEENFGSGALDKKTIILHLHWRTVQRISGLHAYMLWRMMPLFCKQIFHILYKFGSICLMLPLWPSPTAFSYSKSRMLTLLSLIYVC